jgi:uncharacterized membrane protein
MLSILFAPLSPFGLILGALAFLAALTPSMIPRPGVLQGVEAGIAFALLYGVGTGASTLWSWLEAPVLDKRYSRAFLRMAILLCLALVGYGLVRETDWQNAIRRAMGMPAVSPGLPVLIAIVGVPVALFLIALARLFNALARLISARLAKLVPRRIALLVGFGAAAALFWTIGNGLLLRMALHELDSSYRHIDALLPAELSAPEDPFKSGSSGSLVSWASLGAQGRERVVAVPSKSDIVSLTTAAAMEPLRVYVGLNSAETVEQRAELALAELKRVSAFDRAVLVIATPTGTGWVDPSGMVPLEILYRGDVASVSVQYSYLPSWLSLLVEPDYGADTARAVFRVMYDYWRTLPKERRPRLYLFGLSLGARNSDLSADFLDVIADPYQGALWVGPPWDSATWRRVTAMRAAGSPVWLPRFRDDSLFHFATQRGELNEADMRWGPMRMVFLQYPSDPIVFFESPSLWRPPSWMQQRAPDVATEIRWIPVVTFVQQICDMMTATTTPRGVGHVYAAAHYLDGWIAVTEPQGWNAENLARLRDWLKAHDL